MRDGEKDFYIYRYLSAQGFLPNYGFPSSNITLSLSESENEIQRDNVIALSELAPGNTIYYQGAKYQVAYARPKVMNQKPVREYLLICPNCQNALRGETAKTAAACPKCQKPLTGEHPNPNAMQLPDMYAIRRLRITSDEEERMRLGYQTSTHYQASDKIQEYDVTTDNDLTLKIQYEHNGQIIHLKQGHNQKPRRRPRRRICSLLSLQPMAIWRRPNRRPHRLRIKLSLPKKRPRRRHNQRHRTLHGGNPRCGNPKIPPPKNLKQDQIQAYYLTLQEALLQGMQIALNLDESEIDGFITQEVTDPSRYDIILYETAGGGTGAIKALTTTPGFTNIIGKARELLHEHDPTSRMQQSML